MVLDEHGVVQGLVTMTDILESIVGELPSHGTIASPQLVRREDGSWLVDGLVRIDELKERLRIDELPGENTGSFTTVGGFVMMHLKHIPRPSEFLVVDGWRFEVVEMERNRVAKVVISKQPSDEGLRGAPEKRPKEKTRTSIFIACRRVVRQ